MTLSEKDYDERALPELGALVGSLDELEQDVFEAELASDILTLEFNDDSKYVINSHRAARQIWLAAEHSAWHFDWDAPTQSWLARKSGDELWATLRRLLSSKLGRDVALRKV